MQLTREQLEAKSIEVLGEMWSDAYKDLNGFRPRHQPTREELVNFWLTYDERLAAVQDEEAAAERRHREALDREIADMQAIMPHASIGDIMRYIADAEDALNGNEPDWEYLDYKMGVKYGTCEQLAA